MWSSLFLNGYAWLKTYYAKYNRNGSYADQNSFIYVRLLVWSVVTYIAQDRCAHLEVCLDDERDRASSPRIQVTW